MSALEEYTHRFHEAYERRAPDYGWKTQAESAVPWDEVPVMNRALMLDTVNEVFGPLIKERDELLAEVESLKCCGNCGQMADYNAGTENEFTECPLVRAIPDRDVRSDWDYMDGCCYFTPSRWQRRQP